MTNRLMTGATILAFVCATGLLTPVFAQDDATGGDTGNELTDPMPDPTVGEDAGSEDAGGGDVGGEVTIDDGILTDEDGEIAVEDGEPVPYGPDDCIDCNVGPTMVDTGGRPEGENYRGDVAPMSGAISLTEGGSGDSDGICDPTKMGNAAKICP